MKIIKHPITIVVSVLIVLLLAIIGLIKLVPEENRPSAPRVERYWGRSDSHVTVEYFGDFECPACKLFWSDVETPLRENYSDQIKFQYNHFPLSIHPRADKAAEAAEAAGAQGKFFEYAEILYAKQSPAEVQKWNIDTFVEYAKEVGVPDLDKFERELKERYYKKAVYESIQKARERNINATPTVFVNGKLVSNPTLANIEAAIQMELENNVRSTQKN